MSITIDLKIPFELEEVPFGNTLVDISGIIVGAEIDDYCKADAPEVKDVHFDHLKYFHLNEWAIVPCAQYSTFITAMRKREDTINEMVRDAYYSHINNEEEM